MYRRVIGRQLMQLLVPSTSEIPCAGIGGSQAGRGAIQVEMGFHGPEKPSIVACMFN